MIEVAATISNSILVRLSDLPTGAEQAIKDHLTIANQGRVEAIKRGDWGAEEMPVVFELWEQQGDLLVLPRGFARTLVDGLAGYGASVAWNDQTAHTSLPLSYLTSLGAPTLRPEQEEACRAIIANRQGILQSPVGSGKTVMALEAWRRLGERGLVLVEKQHLARQWQERARQHLGVEAGLIGDGVWDERPLTIALMQTIRSRLPELVRSGWFSRWGTTFADEVHHISANSYFNIATEICSSTFVGITATPLEGDWIRDFITAVVGPIIHQVDDRVVVASGATVVPTIQMVSTNFKWIPDARQAKLNDTRVIYRCVIEALQQDEERLHLIVRTIMEQPESSSQLVLAKRLGYLGAVRTKLIEAGYPEDRILMMRGSEKADERAEVARRAGEGSCVILSTLADEGVDIPRFDRLHLIWPQRRELTITQQIGRVLRAHPEKTSPPVVLDFVDSGDGMLYDQARARRVLYRKKGWQIVGPRGELAA